MAETMHALVYHGTNDLRLEERPLPQIQDPRDAIVKVELSSICASDLHIRNGAVPRALPGTVLGHEFVGEVVATGSEVRKVRPGQRVAANVETFCGTCWFCRQGYVNNCRHGGWELGCRIDRAYAGHGYGTEAFTAAAEWALFGLTLAKVKAKCYKENTASYKMLSSCMRPAGEDETFFYFEKTV